MTNWYRENQKMGDIFNKFADFMKVYTAYINNYNEAYKLFSQYTQVPEVAEVQLFDRSEALPSSLTF